MPIEESGSWTGSTLAALQGASLHLAHVSPTAVDSQNIPIVLSSDLMSTSSSPPDAHAAVPSSIFYNYPAARNGPPGRWAHSACAVGTQIIVFGGIGEHIIAALRCNFHFVAVY